MQHLIDDAARAGQHRVLEGRLALPGVRRVLRPGDEAQPPVPVPPGQVRHERGDAGRIVGEHHVEPGLLAPPRDDRDRYPPGQAAQVGEGHDLLGDQQPVDLAGQGADAPLERLARRAERQQQRVLGVPQHRLGGVHDLVDE